MRFQDIVPQLAAGVNFRQSNWARDTYLTLSKDGYINFVFRGSVDDKQYTPNLASAFQAEWVSMENKQHVDVEKSWATNNLFHLLETAGPEEFCLKVENITGSVDMVFFNERGQLTFQNIGEEVYPCTPGISMFLKTGWAVSTRSAPVLPVPVDEPVPVSEGVQEPVLENVNRSTTLPEVTAPEGMTLQVQHGFYVSGLIVGQVVDQKGDLITMQTLTGVHGSRETCHISLNLFELLFESIHWSTPGAVLVNNETGARVTVTDNDDSVAVQCHVEVTSEILVPVTIMKAELNSVNWVLVDYKPQ